MVIQQTTVDGVPTLFVERPGPYAMALAFRVGVIDEALPLRGVTHLVEHLALYSSGLTHHSNGTTGPVLTSFMVSGTLDQARDLFQGVCRSLVDLPLHRLETERNILRTEEAGRRDSFPLGIWRHGARSFGRSGLPEWGLDHLTAEQVVRWASERFTRDNAVLCVAGPEVPDLELALPPGRRHPLPEIVTTVPRFPAYFASGAGGVAFDAFVPRSTAATAYSRLLRRRLYRTLRDEAAISYTVDTHYHPMTADLTRISGFADALADNEPALVGELADTLAGLAAGRVDQEEVDVVRAEGLQSLAHPDVDEGRLSGDGFDLLVGRPLEQTEDLRRELEQLDVAEVRAVAAQVMESLLVQIPVGTDLEHAGYEPAPVTSLDAVEGTRYPALDGSGADLVLGPSGITVLTEIGPATVRFGQVAGVLAFPDGGLHLMADDAVIVGVEPTRYDVDAATWERFRSALPTHLLIPRPARSPEEIPQRLRPGHRLRRLAGRIGRRT